MHFSSNLKFLRSKKGRTQDEAASGLNMKRSTLSGYENGVAEPGISNLISISDYFSIPIDALIKIDLSSLPLSALEELQRGSDQYSKGKKIRILATTVDKENKDNIEIVTNRAKAGYTNGYSDPEYISGLQTCQLPFLHKERKYRIFQLEGDSMLPFIDKSFVTTEYVEDWTSIKDGTMAVFLLKDEGIVFKQVNNQLKEKRIFILNSLNPEYEPYEVKVKDVLEIWSFVNTITNEIPSTGNSEENMVREMRKIRMDINDIKSMVNKK